MLLFVMHAFKRIPFKKIHKVSTTVLKSEIPSDDFHIQFLESAEMLIHEAF